MATRGEVRFGVAAYLDRSVDVVFGNIERRAQRARDVVNRQLGAAGRGAMRGLEAESGRASNKMIGDARRTEKEIERSFAQRVRAAERSMRQEQRLHERMLREQVRAAERAAREQERIQNYWHRARSGSERRRSLEEMRAQRGFDRGQEREQRYLGRAMGYRTAYHGMVRYAPGALYRGARVAHDMLRGAGIETHVGAHVGNVVEAEQLAMKLSAKGYRPGEAGVTGKRVDPRELMSNARQLAKKHGLSTKEILEGQMKFTEKVGNLAGARAITTDLVKLSIGQGIDMGELGTAAGKIDSMLQIQKEYEGDANADKRRGATMALLRGMVLQSKIGSIESGDIARELPKLSGIAGMFQGDVADNLTQLLTLTQWGDIGPAKNAATASTYAQNFALDLTKKAGKIQKTLGIDVFDEQGKLKQIRPLVTQMLAVTKAGDLGEAFLDIFDDDGEIRSALAKTKGGGVIDGKRVSQVEMLSAMLPNKRSYLGMQQALTLYQGAGGGEAGLAKVEAEFERFSKQISQTQLDEDLAIQEGSLKRKSDRFNAAVEEITDTLIQDLGPTLAKASPHVIELISALGKAAKWAGDNPGRAITMLIVASIMRAGLESAARIAMERAAMMMFTGRAGIAGGGVGALPGTGGIVPVGPGGPIGPTNRGTRLARIAGGGVKLVGGAMTGMMLHQTGLGIGDMIGDKDAGDLMGNIGGGIAAGGMTAGLPGAAVGALLGAANASDNMVQRNMGGWGGFGAGFKSLFTDGSFFKGVDEHLNSQARERAQAKATETANKVKVDFDEMQLTGAFDQSLGRQLGKTLKVEVTNLPTPGDASAPPMVSPAGRQAPPGFANAH